MGKPTDAQRAAVLSSASSAHSLQLLEDDDVAQLLTDDDNDDNDQADDRPPSYDAAISDLAGPSRAVDVGPARNSASQNRSTAVDTNPHFHTAWLVYEHPVPGGRRAQSVFSTNTRTVTLDPALSQSARDLFSVIVQQARLPPRPHLQINGSHTDSSRGKKDKNQSNRVVDFDFRLDLVETLLTGWELPSKIVSREEPDSQTWHSVWVAEDHDGIKTYRGSRIKTRTWRAAKQATGYSAIHQTAQSDDPESNPLYSEQGGSGGGEPEALIQDDYHALREWCDRFCNDPSPVKSFTLVRKVENFEHAALINCLTSHIRDTNYRGDITMRMEFANCSLTIYSPHWVNKLRNNKFVFWLCIVLQLWLVTWPIIWILEKRYEVVHSRWYASHTSEQGGTARIKRYARGNDEHGLGELWAPAVKQAAWGHRQSGEVILWKDAQRVVGLTTSQVIRAPVHDSEAEIERRRRVDRGDGTFTDSVVGFVRGVSEVRQGWNSTMGWGGHT